jgi:hypothetical protein
MVGSGFSEIGHSTAFYERFFDKLVRKQNLLMKNIPGKIQYKQEEA